MRLLFGKGVSGRVGLVVCVYELREKGSCGIKPEGHYDGIAAGGGLCEHFVDELVDAFAPIMRNEYFAFEAFWVFH